MKWNISIVIKTYQHHVKKDYKVVENYTVSKVSESVFKNTNISTLSILSNILHFLVCFILYVQLTLCLVKYGAFVYRYKVTQIHRIIIIALQA